MQLPAPLCLQKRIFEMHLRLLLKTQGCYPKDLALCFLLIQETQKGVNAMQKKVFSTDDTDKRTKL